MVRGSNSIKYISSIIVSILLVTILFKTLKLGLSLCLLFIVVIVVFHLYNSTYFAGKKAHGSKRDGANDSLELLSDYWAVFVFFVLSILFSIESPLHPLRNGASRTDSSVFQTIALMMKHGAIPYRDSFDHKGPLIYLIDYLGMSLDDNHGIWMIEVIGLMVTFYMMYRIARFFCRPLIAYTIVLVSLSVLFVSFEGGNLVEEYALPFISISSYIFIDWFLTKKLNKLKLFICGACLGSVLMIRPNMIALWIVFCLGILVKFIVLSEKKNILICVTCVFGGALLIIIPMIIWLGVNGALKDFVDAYITFNFSYSSRYGDATLATKVKAFVFFVNWGLMLFCLIIQILETLQHRTLLNILTLIYMIISLMSVSLSGAQFAHYGMVLFPAVAMPLAYTLGQVDCKISQPSEKWIISVVCAVLLAHYAGPVMSIVINEYADCFATSNVVNEQEIAIVDVIHNYSGDDDSISVYGNYDRLYVISNRKHATRFSYQFPIGEVDSAIFDEYFEELENELPKVVVVQSFHADERMMVFLENNGYSLVLNNEDNSLVYVREE